MLLLLETKNIIYQMVDDMNDVIRVFMEKNIFNIYQHFNEIYVIYLYWLIDILL